MYISGISGLLGLTLGGREPDLYFIPPFIVFLLSYGFGQALTDSFQTDTDAISSPYRPLIGGEITPRQVFWVSLFFLAVFSGILALNNIRILLMALAASAGLILYTPFKKKWWGGPWWNAWIVALLVLMGKMIFVHEFADLTDRSFAGAALSVFFGYAAFVIIGYLKDISADKATGYITFPVKFGWVPTVIVGILHGFVALFAAIIFCGFSSGLFNEPFSFSSWAVVVLLFLAFCGYLYSFISLLGIRDEGKSYTGIIWTIRAFLFMASAMIISIYFSLLPFLIIYYLLFEITIKYRPEKKQV